MNNHRIKVSIDFINNDKNSLCCAMCKRPINLNEFDNIIDSNYKNAPLCYKIRLKNKFIYTYNKINEPNINLKNNLVEISFKPWIFTRSSPTYFYEMETIINNLIIDEKNNYTDIDEQNFRNDLINKCKEEYNINRAQQHKHVNEHNHNHNNHNNHEDHHEHNHEHNY
mgnify:CR=1 FL=1|tara:strand:+ start:1340 stop:1843 length:504 start_codon:yes stop_codon:yes gene_type:complete